MVGTGVRVGAEVEAEIKMDDMEIKNVVHHLKGTMMATTTRTVTTINTTIIARKNIIKNITTGMKEDAQSLVLYPDHGPHGAGLSLSLRIALPLIHTYIALLYPLQSEWCMKAHL